MENNFAFIDRQNLKTGQLNIGTELLAKETNLPLRTVEYTLMRLEIKGIIKRKIYLLGLMKRRQINVNWDSLMISFPATKSGIS